MADKEELKGGISFDTTNAVAGITEMNRAIRILDTEFKSASAGIQDWTSDISGNESKVKSLNGIIDLQKQKVSALTAEYEKAKAESGANSTAAENLAIQVNKAQGALNKSQLELKNTSENLKKLETEQKKQPSLWNQFSASAKKSGSEVNGTVDNLKSHVTGVLATLGIGAGIAGIAKGIYSLAESASDLAEAQNVVENTYKKSSKAVEAWTDTTAKSAGIGKTAATTMVGAMGAMLKSSGVAEKDASAMSEKLVQLTGDMSSFYNVSTSDMWEKIRAGIAGETKPLKDLGVNMDVANLSAFGMANGLMSVSKTSSQTQKELLGVEKAQAAYTKAVKAHGKTSLEAKEAQEKLSEAQEKAEAPANAEFAKLTQSQQAMIRYKYLLSVTADAQNDFAKTTSTSMANQSRIFQMNIEGMKQTVGASFLPAANGMFNAINPLFQQAIPKVSAAIQQLVNNINAHKTDIINSVKSIVSTFQSVFGFISTNGQTIKGVLIGIAGAVVTWKAAVMAANVVQGISNALTVASAIATDGLAAGKTALAGATGSTTAALVIQNGAVVASTAATAAHTIATNVATVATKLFDAALKANPIGIVITAIVALVAAITVLYNNNKQFRDFVNGMFATIKSTALNVITSIEKFISGLPAFITSALNQITSVGSAFLTGISTGINSAITTVKTFVSSAVSFAQQSFTSFQNTLEKNKTAIITVASILGTIFGPALIKTGVQAVTAGSKIAAGFISNMIKSGAEATASGAKITINFVTSMAKAGASAVVNGAKMAVSFTASMIESGAQAVVNGAKIAANFVASMVSAGAEAAVNGAKLAVSFTAAMIESGAAAVVNGAKIAGSFIASMAQAAAQAGITGATILSSVVASIVAYAAEGWKAVASIVATSAAWVAQKAVVIGSTIATQAATAAQWLLNAALNANPVGIVITAVAALTAGIIALYNSNKQFRDFVNGLWEWIKTSVVNTINSIRNINWGELGQNIMKGIVNGFGQIGGWIWGKIQEAGNAIVNGFKNFFGIHSPSTVMRDQVGVNLGKGIAAGVEQTVPLVYGSGAKIGNSIGNGAVNAFKAKMNQIIGAAGTDSETAAKKITSAVTAQTNEITRSRDNSVKQLQSQLTNLSREETAQLKNTSKAHKTAVEESYNTKKDGLKKEIDLRKSQATQEIEQIKSIGQAAKDELDKEVEDRKQFVTSVNDLESNIEKALKSKYEAEDKAQEDSLNNRLTSLDKWKDQSEKEINDYYDNAEAKAEEAANVQTAALQKQIDALDQEADAEDRATKLKEYTDKITDLQKQIAYSHDDYNKSQLQKSLDSTTADYQKQIADYAKEDKKSALQAQLEQIKTNLDAQKKAMDAEKKQELADIDEIYDKKKTRLENQLTAVKDYYAKAEESANLEAEAEKMIMQNNQNDIVALLKSYGDAYKDAGTTLGDMLVQGFQPAIANIKSMIASITASIESAKAAALEAKKSTLATEAKGNSDRRSYSVVQNIGSTRSSASENARYAENAMRRMARGVG